ncbi:hypothetical protein PF003_g16144 [Phytophthora fragariae]|nr:hypothetical protein PF003_g16110 [Phytophthora fragariae]KAE8900065.1 hypothetical protein PF003_g16144 [Phytophthora fragariae]
MHPAQSSIWTQAPGQLVNEVAVRSEAPAACFFGR